METTYSLLYEVVENLQAIHAWNGTKIQLMDQVLRRTWAQICSVLKPSTVTGVLEITSSALPDFIIYARSNLAQSGKGNDNDNDNDNDNLLDRILQFIESKPDLENSDRNQHSLVESALRKIIDKESSARRYAHAFVASRLLELVGRLRVANASAEEAFQDFLCQCFIYDTDYREYPVQDREQFTEADTEKLLSAIDNYTVTNGNVKEGGSMNARAFPQIYSEPLYLQSSDPDLADIYASFLQLVVYKTLPQTDQELLPYAIVMVNFYKMHRNITSFALTEKLEESEIFSLICGTGTTPGIVSEPFREHAIQTLSQMTKEDETSSETPNSTFSQEFVSAGLSQDDIIALVADFETVITTLSEYDSSFDTSLLLAFRNYVFLVYEVFPESAVPQDFQFIDNVVNTIAAVVNYASVNVHSETSAIDEILLDFHDIQLTMSEIQEASTLLMRLSIAESQNALSFATSCLRRWNRKTLVANQLRIIYKEEYLPKAEAKIMKTAFSKWHSRSSTIERLSSEAESYCNKKTLSFYFNEHWIKSIINILEMRSNMEMFQMARYWNVWLGQLSRTRHMESTSDSFIHMKGLKHGFVLWRKKCEKISNLEDVSAEKSKAIIQRMQVLLQQKVWTHWMHQLNNDQVQLFEKLARLDIAARGLTQKKYFEIMKSSVARMLTLQKFKSAQILLLKKHYLGTWQMKICLLNQQRSIIEKRSLALKRSVISCWNDQLHARTSADHTLRKNSLRKYLKIWQTKKVSKLFSEAQAARVKHCFFKKWTLGYKSSSIIKDSDTRAVGHAFMSWNEKLQEAVRNDEKAEAVNKSRCLRKAISSWTAKDAVTKEMKVVADLNFQRKFFNLTWAKHSQVQGQMSEAETLASKKNIVVFVTLGASLKKWQDAYVIRYEEEAAHALEHFQEARNTSMLTMFFKHWKKKSQSLNKHLERLERNLVFFNNTNILKSEFLLHWVDMSRAKADAFEQSISFHNTLLQKKYLVVWYEKYITKSRYLSEIADDHVSKREYHQMLGLLRKWNLAFTKNVRRNQQTCDMFVEKWERNNLQSLFDLWLYKARKRASSIDYAEANTSFASNASPLSRKFMGSGAPLEHLDGSSYLFTPVKKQVARPPFTPAKTTTTTSPTRLQETNQKIKSTKMDALTSRYKQVKREPQSVSSLFRSNSTFLPPPNSKSPSRLPIRPPPAPRFGSFANHETSPDATSSPEISRFIHEGAPSPEVDDRLVATAKRMQRIKPVVIPRNDSPVGFRYSPISKLRERLQSRAEASRAEASQTPSTLFDTS